MSTTVHYFGKIKSQEALRDLQEEFRDIAQVSGWAHEMVDHVFAQEGDPTGTRLTLRGIRLTLSKTTSPIQVTFDKDGYLSHIYYEKAPAEMPGQKPTGALRQVLHQVHTCTNLRPGDVASHIALVKILDYLKKRYVPNLEVIDNTGYWSSRDESVLVPRRLELAKK
ncbi:MAG TPA: hypothetical protein VHE12_00400 [bacterium]|nr:hypothetical protein [bacterium]